MDLNFGFMGVYYIIEAYVGSEYNRDMIKSRNEWKNYNHGYVKGYVLSPTSTEGDIKIIAKGFRVILVTGRLTV